MLKRILLLLVFAALGMIVCNAQQYFTGTVEYKICIGIPKQDTIKIQCEYALHYMKLMPPPVDKSGEKIDEDVVMDWAANCFYVIKKGEKKILKKSFKEQDTSFRFTRENKYPDSVAQVDGIKGSLHNRMLGDSTSFDMWLADSLLLPLPATLGNHSDFFIFCQEKLLLKMSLKDINGALRIQGRQTNFTITAENIKYLPPNDTQYHFPADYKIINEAEQQRISDSIMREFKTADSSLLLSEKDLKTKLDSAIRKVKGLDDEFADSKKKGEKTLPGKRKLKHIKKHTARKP